MRCVYFFNLLKTSTVQQEEFENIIIKDKHDIDAYITVGKNGESLLTVSGEYYWGEIRFKPFGTETVLLVGYWSPITYTLLYT